ncbi:substrate-binding domain-containing protein [Nonomuraea gerenzanensis]|uniref:Transcriptional regulator, LacI (Ribose operon repressor) family n=1 Tax=Nonomuraea gerenzanensis TaxID=93944 RepID=A0A1M4EAP3_9ACTN|nr:substrate-binding domain-containing protein [Nonomuraea gerenzanensis]UBU18195.1 substrate-binding domain-containing protein [Nonomuraea gerenzanensis]SBO96009.1 Transcriptional regulator, LacI (Ribose operon repressor) family [Nonomuraea gerenzanensis]
MPTQQPPARRERKKAETRRAIADAAMRLFALRGFDAVTVSEVAEAADVSAKTVFNYFPVKEQLFYEHEPLLAGDPAEVAGLLRRGLGAAVALSGLLRSGSVGGLALFGRIYRGSETLRAYGRELFAARERSLAEALAVSLAEAPAGLLGAAQAEARAIVRGEGGGRLRARILAATALGPLRQVWESILLEAADRVPPAEAVVRGMRTLEEAYAVLGGAFEAFFQGPGESAKPSGGAAETHPRDGGPTDTEPHGPGLAAARRVPPLLTEQPRALRGERPSIRRVADLAGVSATTVSHTLNGRRPVAEETRRRVLEAIEELGYQPNVLARGLRTSRSQTIGLIIPDITNPFYPALARGLQDVLGPAGYDQIISNTDGVRRVEQAAIEQMIARQVDGLAFAVFHTHAADLRPVIEAGIPVVRLGGRLVQRGVDVVHSDDEGGAAEATRHLLARGYRRIAFVCGPAAEGPAAERVAGYRAALAEAGVPAGQALVSHTEFSRAGGAEGVARLLALPEPPDAVLCANDVMAIGALDVAARRGLRVPEDLAVMGFDDIDAAGLVSPGLTTMANPAREIGQATAVRLLERLRGTIDEPSTELVVPARLVRRQSA